MLYVASEVGGIRDGISQLSQRQAGPQSERTYAVDYMDGDGQTWSVSVTSEPGETPEHLAIRFEADLYAMEQIHPRRR